MDNSLPNNVELLLPPGYRFRPTDEELINEYLKPKANNQPFHQKDMHEVDLYKQSPTELTALHKAKGDGVWYFFTRRNKKYLNGKRPSRTAGDGFWRASSKETKIKDDKQSNQVIGYCRSLSFMKGDKSNKIKTSWIMKEFWLPQNTTNNIAATVTAPHKRSRNNALNMLDGWVLCKIYSTAKPDEETEMRQDQQLQNSQPPLVPLTSSTTQPNGNDHHDETPMHVHQCQQHQIYTPQVPPSASRVQPNDNDNGNFGLLSNDELHEQDDDASIWKDLADIFTTFG